MSTTVQDVEFVFNFPVKSTQTSPTPTLTQYSLSVVDSAGAAITGPATPPTWDGQSFTIPDPDVTASHSWPAFSTDNVVADTYYFKV